MVRALGALAVLAAAAWAEAQPAPGSEFRINSYTTNGQSIPRVAADGQGNYLVVWQSYTQDGSDNGVFARRLSAAGRRLGPEFQVNAYTTGVQIVPTVALMPDGRGVVVWNDIARDGDLNGVFARRVDPTGRPIGDDFQVNVYTTGQQSPGAVAMDDSGGFMVAWTALATTAAFARRFDADGVPLGGELLLGPFRASSMEHVPGGGFVVVGDRVDQPDIHALRLSEAGQPLGSEFLVNTYTTGSQTRPHVGVLGTGGFVVVWQSRPSETDFVDVMARRFDGQGQPIGADFQVNTTTTRHEYVPKVGAREDGSFVVVWTESFGFEFDVLGQRYDPSGARWGQEFRVNLYTPNFQLGPAAAVAPGGQMLVAWQEEDRHDVSGRQFGMLPASLVVDSSPDVSDGNGVLEPGETVRVAPGWANRDAADWDLAGTAASFEGPGSPGAYAIPDPSASYGVLPDGGTASCEGSADCYRIALAGGPRPASHWDATLEEQLSMGASMRWTLHVGGSFADVPPASPFYRFVETLLHHGVTGGCAAGAYCPTGATTREQMASLVLSAAEGPGYQPKACTTPVFNDVPAASPFCRFVEELARRGVVSGCGGGAYCPGTAVSRQEMAVFVLRTLDPALAPPACGTPTFGDVPASSPFCPWIEELARRGVVAGCGGGDYCPGAAVTREQVAVFVSRGFGLMLYGP